MAAACITRPMAAKDDSAAGAPPSAEGLSGEPLSVEPIATVTVRMTPAQIVIILLGTIAFLYLRARWSCRSSWLVWPP